MLFKGYTLTAEQQQIVKTASIMKNGQKLIIKAGAGATKTFTCLACAQLAFPQERGLYLAYNRQIVSEVEKDFPDTVVAKTSHGLAYDTFGKKYEHRLKARLHGYHLARILNLDKPIFGLVPASFCNFVLKVIQNYCISDDEIISIKHCQSNVLRLVDRTKHEQLKELVVKCAKRFWMRLIDLNEALPISHDIYLKLYALYIKKNKISLPYDFIMVDEFQDTAPVIQGLIMSQKNCRLIGVGDSEQQLYSWRGAIDSMECITPDFTGNLNKSFRFGNNVAQLANLVNFTYKGITTHYVGNECVHTEIVTDRNAPLPLKRVVICRTNEQVMKGFFGSLVKGERVTLIDGVQKIFELVEGAEALQNNLPTSVEMFKYFQSWNELVAFSKTEMGGDLRALVNLTQSYSLNSLKSMLSNLLHLTVDDADVVYTTGHKCKGCEFKSVVIAGDFPMPYRGGLLDSDESNLLYVALTRAIKYLNISRCDALMNVYHKHTNENLQLTA